MLGSLSLISSDWPRPSYPFVQWRS